MATVEKISIALPAEMVSSVREAVETGDYASSSEVIREALRDWAVKRSLRRQGVEQLRQVWQDARAESASSQSTDEVLERLERKYQALSGQRD